MHRRWGATHRLVAVAASVGLVAGACGGDDGEGTGTVDTTAARAGHADTTSTTHAEPRPGPGFDGSTITIGLITPLTGPAALIGNPLANGHQVYFDYVNEELGGVAGRYQLELVTEDDQFDPATAVAAYERIKNDVVMIADFFATSATEAVLPRLEQDGIIAGTVDFDSRFIREQYILPIGAPYEIEAINAVSYWQQSGGGADTVCVAYRDDPYFSAAAAAITFAAERMGLRDRQVAFAPDNQDWATPLEQLEDCEFVFLAASLPDAVGILRAAAQAQFTPQWIGQSPIGGSVLPGLVGGDYVQANVWVVGPGTEWGDESVPGMAQLLEHVRRYDPDQQPDEAFVRGYAQAWAVHQVLENAVEMGDLGRLGIIDAMNSLETLTFGGLLGDYAYGPPEQRNPPRGSTIFRVVPEAPGGFSVLSEVNFVSEAAEAYQFPP